MSTTHRERSSRSGRVPSTALLLALSLSVLGAASAFAQGASSPGASGGDTPIGAPIAPGEPNPNGDGATPAFPDPTLIDLHQQPWDHISVAPDGRTLTVHFWGGVQACYGLGRVDVTSPNGQLTITLWTGNRPGDHVCIELAMLYSTVVVLDAPIIGGGAA